MRIVVTGNIGCGKSTAVKHLHALLPHYELFDFDQMVEGLYKNEGVRKKLIGRFGTADKKEVSNIVFGDDENLKQLREVLDGLIMLYTMTAARRDDVILDIPLYFEYFDQFAGFRFPKPDVTVAVITNEVTQIERVKARNGFSEEKIRSIMEKQMPQGIKMERANFVIANTGTIDDLKKSVEVFTTTYDLIK